MKFNNLLIQSVVNTSISGYNRVLAVNYAYKWVFLRNPSYSYYNNLNDCTNFTSQVLEAGLVSYIVDGVLGKYDTKNWYYTSSAPSWTWGGANNFYSHAKSTTSRYQIATYFSDLKTGDILQVDFDGNGTIDHSTVVTKITGTSNSQIFLSYHTTDTKDKKLSDFITASGTNAKFYGWKVIF